jgi:hypothetical protein
MRFPLVAIAALFGVSPALADAVTYKGTLGKAPIIVEFSADVATATGAFAGRYSYLAKGIDIPLDAQHVAPGKLDLVEEKPCTIEICRDVPNDAPEGTLPTPPLGAKWQLQADGKGKVSGTWTDGGKVLPVLLQRAGSRPLPARFVALPVNLTDILTSFYAGEQGITAKTSPYDFLKMQVPLKHSNPTRWGKVAFDFVTDPRTKFAFPNVTDLGGADRTAINGYLATQHWELNASALACAAAIYQGLGWNETMRYEAGSLGGFADETFNVTYLSPTVMSWTEGGSLWCGGASPDNHFIQTNVDVRTGTELDMSRIFKGWVPRPVIAGTPTDPDTVRAHPENFRWGPDQKLADFVRAHRSRDGGAELESECGYDDLIVTNLKISFYNGEEVAFGLDNLPHAIQNCGDTLYGAPLASVRELLTPQAVEYFPSLRAAN